MTGSFVSARFNALNDLARQRADVRPAMAANFRFIVHAAQSDAHEFAAQRSRDRLAERSLAHARRPDEAQDRPLHARLQFLHRQVIEDALLDLLQIVVIFVENLCGPWRCRSPRCPEDLVHGSDVIHSRYVRDTMYSAEAGVIFASRFSLAIAFLLGFRRHAGLFHFFAQLVDLLHGIVGFAEFLLNRLHLLAQQIFALVLAHLLLNLFVNLRAQLQNFQFLGQFANQRFQPLAHVRRLDQFLANHRGKRRQRAGDEVRQAAGIVDVHRHGLQIVGKLRRMAHHIAEQFLRVALQRFQLGIVSALRSGCAFDRARRYGRRLISSMI